MAQIWLGSTLGDRSTDQEVEGKSGQLPTYKFRRKRTFLVIADDADETEDDILANANVPALGNTSTLGYPVKSRSAKERDYVLHPISGVKTILWEVEVSCDSSLSFAFPPGGGVLPENFPPKYKWTQKEREVDFYYDVITGEPLLNTVNEPIFASRKILYPVLTITRYESYYQDLSAKQAAYGNTVNSVAFGSFNAGECLMNPIVAEEETFEIDDEGLTTVTYLKVTYEIDCLVNDYYSGVNNPWKRRFLNQGYYYRPAPGAPPVLNVVDGNKTIVNLALNGTILPDDQDPIWLPFNEFKTANWTALNLDPTPDEPTP